MTRRVEFLLAVLTLAASLLAGCGGQETPVEKAEEEAGVEEVLPKEQPKGKGQEQEVFAGEHENLQSGDTAEWNVGMNITIDDVHVALNENRRMAEENVAKGRGGEGAKKSPSLQGPERLITFSWTISNDGQIPLNFRGNLPCQALDQNGLELSTGSGQVKEQADPKNRANEVLKQPLEQGQTRSGIASIGIPESGAAEYICVHPPQQGGEPNIAQIPEAGRATWIFDPAKLEFRE